MAWDSKVLWTEGLFLQPHHFQQADRHLEALVQGLATRLAPCAWGVSQLEIDEDALRVGRFALRAASGLTQEGLVFRIPGSDDHPPALEVPPGTRDCLVYLTVPQRRQGAAETDPSGVELSPARLRVKELEVTDTMGQDRKPVVLAVGGLRLQYALGSDDLADRLTIPVARILEVRPDLEVVLDKSFIPACLDLRASGALSGFLQELEGLLSHRMVALSGRLAQAGAARGAAEVQDFLLLMVVNRLVPVLRMRLSQENFHPMDFYADCLAMAGELSAFLAAEKHPPVFQPYRHHDLSGSFAPVMRVLRRYLSAVLEQNAVPIPLEARQYGISVGQIADRRLIGSSAFYLAVTADVPAEGLRRHFSGQAKIGPVEEIRQLVNSALPGINLRALPVAPRQIPYHAGAVYFELEPDSSYWARMTASGGVAVHVSGEYPGLKMELWAVRQG